MKRCRLITSSYRHIHKTQQACNAHVCILFACQEIEVEELPGATDGGTLAGGELSLGGGNGGGDEAMDQDGSGEGVEVTEAEEADLQVRAYACVYVCVCVCVCMKHAVVHPLLPVISPS